MCQEVDVSVSCCTEIDKTTENSVAPIPTTLGSINVETILSNQTMYSDLLARSYHEAHCQDLEGKHSNSEGIIADQIFIFQSHASRIRVR